VTDRFRWRVQATALVAAIGLATGLVACTSTPPSGGSSSGSSATGPGTGTSAPTEATVLRLGVSKPDPARPGAGLDTLDPADVVPTNQADMIAVDLLFESLTTIDPVSNEAKPALAESVTPSADLLTWTFKLRAGAQFADGTPIKASDVKFTLERIARKGVSSLPGASLDVLAGYTDFLASQDPAAGLSGVTVVDDRTVTIATSEPFAGLAELLASPLYGIVPQAAVTAAQGLFGEKPVGSGSYSFVSGGEEKVELTKARDSKAQVDQIELVKFADRDGILAAMREHKVDWAEVPVGHDAPPDLGKVMPGPASSESFFAFNLGSPVYANPQLRQAIVKAVDRTLLATSVLHSAQPLGGVVPPGIPGSQPDACGTNCSFDPEGAKALLAEAFPAGNYPTVHIDVYTGTSEDAQTQQAVANSIQANLGGIGLPAEVRAKSFEEYRKFVVSGDRELFSYGWVGLAPEPDFFMSRLFLSASPDNVTGYKDANVDAAIKDARATADRSARLAKYQQLEQVIMGGVPIMPLAVLNSSVVVGPAVGGYQSRFDGTFVADAVTITR
jgi:ABC-type transport system substrate-binding protein